MAKYLSERVARRFYDRVAGLEDTQAFYEDPALDKLIAIAGFETSSSVFEFGCGTGRLAQRLLSGPLGPSSRYVACDISPRMANLARTRLAHFGARVRVVVATGDPPADMGQERYDRIVTSYVLDLLPPAKITDFLASASESLAEDGLLCIASIAPGSGWPSRPIMRTWATLGAIAPILTGGCRPIEPDKLVGDAGWRIKESYLISAWGVTSRVVTASPPE